MHKEFNSLLILIISILIMGCDQDPCDVAHTVVDGECIPDFIFPQNQQLKTGDRYYHAKFGIIVFKNGDWYNDNEELVEELNTKKN